VQDEKLSDVLFGVHEKNGRSAAVYTMEGIGGSVGLGFRT